MSPIGSLGRFFPASGQRGFSLIEALLSVVILSIGLVLINQALLYSLTASDYANTRAEVNQSADKKIWEVKNAAWSQGVIPPFREEGVLLEGKDSFPYEMRSVGVRGSQFLYEVRLKVNWLNSGRQKGLTRTFYARLPNETK